MIDFSPILDHIPDWDRFLTVDELIAAATSLAAEFPDRVKLLELGRSTKGETIYCLQIGHGRYNAFVHGFPNTEEPYGGNLLTYFSRALAENPDLVSELDYTWYLVPCSDPDGARLNEGFQTGPLTPLNFCLNYYRTPYSIMPESCFPFRYGPLDLNNPTAETRALMKVLDSVRINLISSLHMMKWGGISYMVPHPCPELYPDLQNVAKRFNVFLRKRPGTTLAPGIMQAAYVQPARNWLRHRAQGNTNIEPIAGCYIYEYAQVLNPNAFIIIPECCIWYDPRMLDDRPSGRTFGEALACASSVTEQTQQFMLEIWRRAEPLLNTDSPWRRMVAENMEPLIAKYTHVSDPPFEFDERVHGREITIAEDVGIRGHDDLYRMFPLGSMYLLFNDEYQASGAATMKELRDTVHAKLLAYDRFLHDRYQVVTTPIHDLVGVGIGAILHAAEYAKTIDR